MQIHGIFDFSCYKDASLAPQQQVLTCEQSEDSGRIRQQAVFETARIQVTASRC